MRPLLALLCCILVMASSCITPKPLEYRGVDGFRIETLTLGESKVALGVRLFNPNSYGLQLKGGNIGIYLNNNFVGSSSVEQRTVVPGGNEFILPLGITANLRELLGNALQLLMNPKVNVRLKGNIKAGKGGVFVNVPIDWVTEQSIQIR